MAKMTLKGLEEVSILISRMADKGETIAKAAVFAGAAKAAEELRRQIQALPEESGYVPEGQQRKGVKPSEKRALLEHIGISHMDVAGDKVSSAIGFDGYAEDLETHKHPNGLPVPLLARSIESGSSVRKKNPFIRRAANAVKASAQQAMQIAAYEEIEKITGG